MKCVFVSGACEETPKSFEERENESAKLVELTLSLSLNLNLNLNLKPQLAKLIYLAFIHLRRSSFVSGFNRIDCVKGWIL